MGNFKVGDKVEIIDASRSCFENGDIGIIKVDDRSSCPYGVERKGSKDIQWYTAEQLKLVESKPSKKQRIETLEKEVSELKLIVHELRERKEVTVALEIDGEKLSTASIIGSAVEPSTDISVEDKQADVIEFEGQQYRKVEREAVEGDVVVFTSIPEDESGVDVEEGKPYRAYEGEGLYKKYIKDDTGFTLHIYGGGILRGTTETVNVYEPINQPVQRQTVPCSATRPPIEEVGEAFFEAASEVLNPKTANELRAEVIEKAKGFVEETKNFTGSISGVKGYRYDSTGLIVCNAEFIVNAEKRTIVALLKPQYADSIHAKGIAKCNPSDVFNEHIGKAIALGRALGLDVSEFEQAVQPSEYVVGQEVTYTNDIAGKYKNTVHQIKSLEDNVIWYENRKGYSLDGGEDFGIKIINDTNAIYGGVE